MPRESRFAPSRLVCPRRRRAPAAAAARLWARYRGLDRSVRSGEYRFTGRCRRSRCWRCCSRRATTSAQVTIPEGLTARQVAAAARGARLRRARRVPLRDGGSGAAARVRDCRPRGVEGYLFPDTYAFDPMARAGGHRARDGGALPQAERRLAARRERDGTQRVEMVTLASVIEKETGQADERHADLGRVSQPAAPRHAAAIGSRPCSTAAATGAAPLTRADLDEPQPVQHLRPPRPAARARSRIPAAPPWKPRSSPRAPPRCTSSRATTARTSFPTRWTSTIAPCGGSAERD